MGNSNDTSNQTQKSWLDSPLLSHLPITWETVIFLFIILLAVITRFYDLGSRVMSHDETTHVYYSWRLYKGMGYEHTPLSHGPWQFIFIALTYFLFGDSDFTARIPAALSSIATVMFLWNYRRWLGRTGTLVAAGLLVISPFMLYYARYVRNEAYVGLFGVITLWAILRYLEKGDVKYLYVLTLATVMHFTAKETAFIYTAQALLFLGFLFLQKITSQEWHIPNNKKLFLITLITAFVFLGVAFGIKTLSGSSLPTVDTTAEISNQTSIGPIFLVFLAISVLAVAGSIYFLIRGYTAERIKQERSAEIIILLITLVLPQLAPFPVRLMGNDPLDYSMTGMLKTGAFLIPLALITVGIGLWWRPKIWLINAAIFYGVFVVFYTTIFTNGQGFFTGLVGSLGYWLEQQDVQRGNQPWYYYVLIQVPIYEYLPALGSILAAGFGLKSWFSKTRKNDLVEIYPDEYHDGENALPENDQINIKDETIQENSSLPLLLFGFWIITSVLAYSFAGEKMPWLTFHISLPMILVAGWALGKVIDGIDWQAFHQNRGWVVIGLLLLFIPSFVGTIFSLTGTTPPFQGSELSQLQATSNFLTAFLSCVLSGFGLQYILKTWDFSQSFRLAGVVAFSFLSLLTAKAAFTAAYINYDNPKEYLVYAHSATGVKEVLAQIEEISRRTTDGLAMEVAYDNETTYPYWWYLRNYTNQNYYGENPTRDLRDAPVILVGDDNYGKIEPVVANGFYQFDYIRMWWPNQDYFDLNWDRIRNAIADPQMRAALFDIWLNRDYSKYAKIKGSDISLPNWSPSDRMRLYIRKDIVNQLWNYGAAPVPEDIFIDPYEGKEITLVPQQFIGSTGSAPGQFQAPKGLEIAPDGTLYVADSGNHRIQHITPDGTVLHSWGTYANILNEDAPPGTFQEPWDVAVGPDGSVYVADTWNHRIQKFTADGIFITMWGVFGQAETGDAFWGPRSVEVSDDGRVFVSDTGNKRIAIFDENGNFLGQTGSVGFAPGQFDEPVGIALDASDNLYVADTWNQRLQILSPNPNLPNQYTPLRDWDIVGWYGQSLENKPYLSVNPAGDIFVTDPEGYRVLHFNNSGEIIDFWGDYSTGTDGFGLVSGIAIGPDGLVWVSDGVNNRILGFRIP